MTTYVYDHETEQVVRKVHHQAPDGPLFMPDIKSFRSPIDGEVITSRSQLRAHERKHGVRQVGNDWSGSERPPFWDQVSR